ncbi:MAG: PrsW family intramembrane metalloprotease [Kastovskya adunca ATA6-11-RM4]|jgi:RsiW-degrading membrane proteinase PrsW (M82 family)|nr:PrsW family intramembrane metalloprotease [Kastovskya adunca ATA6-11-RM4]
MKGQAYKGFLRQLSTGEAAGRLLPNQELPEAQELALGRDPSCQMVLEPNQYPGVSRRHVLIRPVALSDNQSPGWEICDLNSANGTYINGRRLQGCQPLRSGDRFVLGEKGPEFLFESLLSYSSSQAPSPQTAYPPTVASAISQPPLSIPVGGRPPDAVTFTQLFPIVSTGRDLTRKAFLIPGIFTVVFVVLMFAAVGQPIFFNLLLAAYLAGAAYYFVYQLCGKRKPWWWLLGAAIATGLILVSPLLLLFITVFRGILPGSLPSPGEPINFLSLLIRMFFGAGLMEELLKALPVLLAYWLGQRWRSPWRERLGVWEPLDGILLGTASAVGFTLLETLGQYVPGIIDNVTLQTGEGTGQLLGLQLLIPRILGSVAGHMAYSGYFGYFIGLSVLKPNQRWQILGIGYLSASALHALWNSTGFFSGVLLALVGVLSYAFLAAAILKARALSPTRSQNFATRFLEPPH